MPVNWPTVLLQDIFVIDRGGSPRPIDAFITDDPSGVNWVSIGDASDHSKYITGTKRRIRQEGVAKSRLVKPGDFLLTNSMSFGRPYIMRTHGCVHDGWLVLTPRTPEIDQDFFYHLLGSNAIYAEFVRLAAGATVKNLNIDLVKRVKVPVPTLAEQQRIAAILDQAEALKTRRRQAFAKLDNLTQSLFLEMFGDPQTNPKRWVIQPFGCCARNEDAFRRPVKASDRAQKQGQYDYYGASGVIDKVDSHIFEGERLLIAEDGANLLARSTPIAFRARGKYWVNNHAHVVAYNNVASLAYLEVFCSLTDVFRLHYRLCAAKAQSRAIKQNPNPHSRLFLNRSALKSDLTD